MLYPTPKAQPQESKLVPEVSMLDRDQNSTLMPSTTKRESQVNEETEENIVEQPHHNFKDVIREELDDDDLMPPQIERENTKDSSFKNSTEEKLPAASMDQSQLS